jgi:hypothetical protein
VARDGRRGNVHTEPHFHQLNDSAAIRSLDGSMGQIVSNPYVVCVALCFSVLIYDLVRSVFSDWRGRAPADWRGKASDEPTEPTG